MDKNTVEVQCANGECGKMSKVNESEKTGAYVSYLEKELLFQCNRHPPSPVDLGQLFRTKNGWRRVLNSPNSIQWALLAE
jgi:hypothetical protein